MKVEVYKDEAGDWRWRKIANNNKVIATSGEGYENRRHALAMAAIEAGDEGQVVLNEDEE